MHVTIAPTAPADADPIAALRRAVSGNPAAAFRAASLALRAEREDDAVPLLRAAVARHGQDPRLWQMLALATRNLGKTVEAVDAFTRARDLAPADALIAHGVARARLEAGVPAIDDFLLARRLAPSDGSLVLGLAAARFAARDIAGAIADVETEVGRNPLWLEGHATLARLRRMAGDGDDMRSYRQASSRVPGASALWLGWLSTLTLAERFADMAPVVDGARRALGRLPMLDLYAAIAADETGDHARAGSFFDALPASVDPGVIVWQVRSLLRRGRMTDAADMALRGVGSVGGRILWPYLALAWRAMDDPRWQWLEGDERFVRVHDLSTEIGDLSLLAALLRDLHVARDRPLDQSVRGGTQTDGPLLARTEPQIVRLRDAIRAAVSRYVAALPPPDSGHPLLSAPRRSIRFAGSWSVRLTSGGHHADHVHSHGWISSALYVALPDSIGGDARAGWLTLGASSALMPDVLPFREIEPRPGRLVLFPSTMWHGTRPFAAGERLTVAFDVTRMTA